MAKGRMIARAIVKDPAVAKLSDKAALLYTWLIPFLDRQGKFYALPCEIKGEIMSRRPTFTLSVIEKCLKEIDVELGRIYGKNREYIVLKGFLNHNNPHPHEPKSDIPDYQGKNL